MFAELTVLLSRRFPVASFVLTLVAACSGHTKSGEAGGGDSGTGGSTSGSTATPGGASGMPLTPGTAGSSDANEAMGGQSAAGGATTGPLKGAAFFDFDCSPNGTLPKGDACAVCEQTLCKEELAGAIGDNWSTGQADGPCKAWFDCLQDCTCNDQDCYKACTSKLSEAACLTAFAPFDACLSDMCQSSCSSSGTR